VLDSDLEAATGVARRLAHSKAVRTPVRLLPAGIDREDLEAELMLRFWQNLHAFDSRRASLPTFASRIMENHCASLIRRCRAQKRVVNARSLNDLVLDDDGHRIEFGDLIADPMSETTANRDYAIDIRRVVDRIPAGARDVADALADLSPSQTALALRRSRPWVYQQIGTLRAAFEAVGIGPDCVKS
jgi:RNA polymerase sigma factor (sigma-70 family)